MWSIKGILRSFKTDLEYKDVGAVGAFASMETAERGPFLLWRNNCKNAGQELMENRNFKNFKIVYHLIVILIVILFKTHSI